MNCPLAIDMSWLDRLETEAAALSIENATRHREHRGEREVRVDPDELLTLIGLAKAWLKAQRRTA